MPLDCKFRSVICSLWSQSMQKGCQGFGDATVCLILLLPEQKYSTPNRTHSGRLIANGLCLWSVGDYWGEGGRWGVYSFIHFVPASCITFICFFFLKKEAGISKKSRKLAEGSDNTCPAAHRPASCFLFLLQPLFHHQSKKEGSVRKEEKFLKVNVLFDLLCYFMLWKNVKFFCVFIHFINLGTKNNWWNYVIFHIEFFPSHNVLPV